MKTNLESFIQATNFAHSHYADRISLADDGFRESVAEAFDHIEEGVALIQDAEKAVHELFYEIERFRDDTSRRLRQCGDSLGPDEIQRLGRWFTMLHYPLYQTSMSDIPTDLKGYRSAVSGLVEEFASLPEIRLPDLPTPPATPPTDQGDEPFRNFWPFNL